MNNATIEKSSKPFLIRGVDTETHEHIKLTAPVLDITQEEWLIQALADRVARQQAIPEVAAALKAMSIARNVMVQPLSSLDTTAL